MKDEKCFCHFNGYKVKDATAQKMIEENKDNIFEQNKGVRTKLWVGSEEEFNALSETDNNTIYIKYNSDGVATFDSSMMSGLVNVDEKYKPLSNNPQSGKAVAQAVTQAIETAISEIPFISYNVPCNEKGASYEIIDGVPDRVSMENCSPIMKCPKYLGFRIEGEGRLYLYIGTIENGDFKLDENYIISTSSTRVLNYLRDKHNRFIKIDGERYFYYKIEAGSTVSIIGCDEFPIGESNIIATTPNFVGYQQTRHLTNKNYYSVVLPSGCFYAVLNKNGMSVDTTPESETTPEYELNPEIETNNLSFNVSYQTGIANGEPIINVNRGVSFGYIPENVGICLLRIPNNCNLNDLQIYTNKIVKSNTNTGMRINAKKIGEKVIKDFVFNSQKPIFWNDSTRLMVKDRQFFGVPYSSRWVNSHYIGFEVTPETALNALSDPYSIAYDGGFDSTVIVDDETVKVRGESVSGHTEISEDGGTGYGLVCSAFNSLLRGNPYPQTNRGFTFDENFIVRYTSNFNSGDVLLNKTLTHSVFVDEIYDKGFSLFNAVDPCIAKTIHTCERGSSSYGDSKVRITALDNCNLSVINKDTSGYNAIKNPDGSDKLALLKEFDSSKIPISKSKVRVWRGNKAVYGPWDKSERGSGIGVTLHDGLTSFTLKTPYGSVVILEKNKFKNDHYCDISKLVNTYGTYEINDGTVSEFFRFYSHDTVKLTFDTEGKAVFKNSNGSIADDVEYVYVKVRGYGSEFDIDDSEGTMVIAKGQYYPDLARDVSRIVDVRGAIVSDIAMDNTLTESWGKFTVDTFQTVESEYKENNDGSIEIIDTNTADVSETYGDNQVYNANVINEYLNQIVGKLEGLTNTNNE